MNQFVESTVKYLCEVQTLTNSGGYSRGQNRALPAVGVNSSKRASQKRGSSTKVDTPKAITSAVR